MTIQAAQTAQTAQTAQAAAQAAPGRKRDASRDDALCQAALEVLAEVGYDRLTIDAVAARAGAGKATCYRRWAGKAELVVDAVGRMKSQPVQPDTGSLRGDLVELSRHLHDRSDSFQAEVQAGLLSGLVRDANLREVFAEHFIAPRKAVFRTVFDQAIERGEIARVPNYELLSDIIPSMVFHRLILTGRPPAAEFVITVIDQIILPLVMAPTVPTVPAEPTDPSATTSAPEEKRQSPSGSPSDSPSQSPSQNQTRTPSS